mgnify:CR=1 FL=1
MATAKNNKATEAQKQEGVRINLCGTVTDLMFGRHTYNNGRKDKEDKYRLSVELAAGEMDKFIAACKPMYEKADEKYIPKFLNADATEDEKKYLNLKSSFPFGFCQRNGRVIEDLGTVEDVLKDLGNINGSKVVVTIIIKEGAFYPVAVCIVQLVQKTLADYYGDFDFSDLPF